MVAGVRTRLVRVRARVRVRIRVAVMVRVMVRAMVYSTFGVQRLGRRSGWWLR